MVLKAKEMTLESTTSPQLGTGKTMHVPVLSLAVRSRKQQALTYERLWNAKLDFFHL